MLNEKSFNHVQQRLKRTTYLFLPLLLLLTGCSSTNIPGLDRILFPNSSAEVGPLVIVDKQYPVNANDSDSHSIPPAAEIDSGTGSNADTVQADNSEPNTVTQAGNKPKLEPNPILENSSSDVAAQASKREIPARVETKVQQHVAKHESHTQTTVEHGAVSGQVVLISEEGHSLEAEGTLITLTPKNADDQTQNHSPKRHVIDMENKEYQPQYSTINAGDQVVFVNKDNIQHNVFSPSGSNSFDLGTYGAGLKRAVTLSEPGIVKVYCNIHADMATFVAVANPGLSVKADDQGRYRIDNVPRGTYDMTIWNIRGETTRTIEVKSKETLQLVDRVNTAVVKTETHKNKYGGNYSNNSALFKDEFY